ncbi:hypothetical protein Tco_0923720 [Tanacetum coccineum]|uniref:Retrovirus-related Pol polyprotein from transposon TNT 1-94-like beta-barrel domain-containing protein n=1 Tax=Tanacetum coccineum TaxID=301880 RepID=A0ABQ5D527_9ASTR
MEQRIKILENDFKRAETQYVNLDLKMQHQKEKMACVVSWKLKMTNLSDENMLLKTQVQSTVQERENIKLEYQKLFNSVKATLVQNQQEVNELVENVNQKTYAYADVPAKNQDLLMTISELKAKLAEQAKNKRVLPNTKSKSTSEDVKKSQSSFTSDANKNDTLNSNVSKSKINVLNAKTVNVVHDGSNLGKRPLFTSIVAAKCSKLGTTLVVAKSRFSVATPLKATNKVFQTVLWIVDSGCLKHMTRNLKLLRNFVEKFMSTVRFGNDNFAAITGHKDYVKGNLTICHIYYVEGLGHNLFSVGQFCDGDLEVAFRSNTCFIRNLEGKDLVTGSRKSNLYTISISEMAASSLVCLMSKAMSTKSWYVVPTGRVKVPTGKDNDIVSAGRTKVIPAGSTILVLCSTTSTGVKIVTTSRYVVPTGRVKVPAGRYVVPTGKDNV